MSAPSTVYKDFILPDKTTAVTRDIYVAAFLQNPTPTTGSEWGTGYFNEVDIPPIAANHTVAVNKILNIFKVDKIFPAAKDTVTNGSGFVGGITCSSDGTVNGTNAQYHNPNRYSGRIYQEGPTGPFYRILNDAGLNTRASSSIITNDPTQVWWSNYISYSGSVWSAFYTGTTEVGIEYRLGGTGSWVQAAPDTTPLPSRSTKAIGRRGINTGGILGNTIDIRMYTDNEEGRSYSENTLTGTLADEIHEFIGNFYSGSYAGLPGVPTHIYMTLTTWNGLSTLNENTQGNTSYYGYNSDLLTDHIPDGLYWFQGPTKSGYYRYDGMFTQLALEASQPGGTGGEEIPEGYPRVSTGMAGAIIDNLSFMGKSTGVPNSQQYLVLGTGAGVISGEYNITGIRGSDPGDPVESRYAKISLRRQNSNNPSLDEVVSAGEIVVVLGQTLPQTLISEALTKGVSAPYDRFSFFEDIT